MNTCQRTVNQRKAVLLPLLILHRGILEGKPLLQGLGVSLAVLQRLPPLLLDVVGNAYCQENDEEASQPDSHHLEQRGRFQLDFTPLSVDTWQIDILLRVVRIRVFASNPGRSVDL